MLNPLIRQRAETIKLILAFFAVYVFWGSTYIAIHFALQSFPAFLMSGARFLLAGLILFIPLVIKQRRLPRLKDWGIATVLGFLLIFAGNAGSTWAVKHIPSGLSALLVATEPIWIVVLSWMMGHCSRPKLNVVLGMLLGLAGMAVLFGSDLAAHASTIEIVAMCSVIVAAFFWALGSVVGLRWHSDLSPYMSSALMLIMGGLMFGALGTATGEVSALRLSQVSLTSVLATLYLAIFGSVVSLTAYVWLLRKCPPHKVATYAFVNPVVAIVLGCVLAGEALTQNSAIAMVLIVASTALLVMKKGEAKHRVQVVEEKEEPSLTTEPVLQAS